MSAINIILIFGVDFDQVIIFQAGCFFYYKNVAHAQKTTGFAGVSFSQSWHTVYRTRNTRQGISTECKVTQSNYIGNNSFINLDNSDAVN